MAVTIVKGNVTPSPGVMTDLFTVPASVSMQGCIVLVKNTGTVAQRYTIAIAQGGGAYAVGQNICTNQAVPAGKTIAYPISMLLQAGDKCRVSSDGTTVNFATQSVAQ